jgi:hypothetical protein
MYLKPNLGDNPNAQTENSILNWMERYAGDGPWINEREIKRSLHYSRKKVGNWIWGRAIANLVLGEDLELKVVTPDGGGPKSNLLRLRRS